MLLWKQKQYIVDTHTIPIILYFRVHDKLAFPKIVPIPTLKIDLYSFHGKKVISKIPRTRNK